MNSCQISFFCFAEDLIILDEYLDQHDFTAFKNASLIHKERHYFKSWNYKEYYYHGIALCHNSFLEEIYFRKIESTGKYHLNDYDRSCAIQLTTPGKYMAPDSLKLESSRLYYTKRYRNINYESIIKPEIFLKAAEALYKYFKKHVCPIKYKDDSFTWYLSPAADRWIKENKMIQSSDGHSFASIQDIPNAE